MKGTALRTPKREVDREVYRTLLDDAAENQVYLDAIKRGDLSPRSARGRAALLLARCARMIRDNL